MNKKVMSLLLILGLSAFAVACGGGTTDTTTPDTTAPDATVPDTTAPAETPLDAPAESPVTSPSP